MKKQLFSLLVTSITGIAVTHASNLVEVYQQAVAHDLTFKQAAEQYQANEYQVPIDLAALLPQITATGNMTWNKERPTTTGPANYRTNEYQLTLTQSLFNFGAWKTLSAAKTTLKANTATFLLSSQQLINNVAKAYFAVLLAQDQLRYAKQNKRSLKEQLEQVEQQYKVGVKAYTDVQATKSSYESAVATEISDENNIANALQDLQVLTGRPESHLAPLKAKLSLIKPQPADAITWVNYALQHNLSLQSQLFAAKASKQTIWAAFGGTSSTPGFLPSLSGSLSYQNALDHSNSYGRVQTETASVSATLNAFNGGETYATMKQDYYNYRVAKETAANTRRNLISSVQQDYLNVLSDISQIHAYQQAIASGESALEATRAAYKVGTRTIVDVLTEQSSLFKAQQNYAEAINQYIIDSLKLKFDAGTLTVNDIVALNHWLQTKTTKASSSS